MNIISHDNYEKDGQEITLDAIRRLANLISNSNDIQFKNDIISNINKIDTNVGNNTMNIAMNVLKTQITTAKTDTKLIDLDIDSSIYTITKSQLDFEKALYYQLLRNTSDVFISHLKRILNDITNSTNVNSMLRALNILNVINNQIDYDFKAIGSSIIESIEPILKYFNVNSNNIKNANITNQLDELVSASVQTCSIVISQIFNKSNNIYNKIVPSLLQLGEDNSKDINMRKNAIITALYCVNTNVSSSSSKCYDVACSFFNQLNIVTSDLSKGRLSPLETTKEMSCIIDIFNAINNIFVNSNTTSDINDTCIKLRVLPLLKTVYYKQTSSLFVNNLLYCHKKNVEITKDYYTSIVRILRTEIVLFGLKDSMYQQLLELIISNYSNNASLDFFAMVFNATIDDLHSSRNLNVYTNDLIAYLLEHLNRISNSNNISYITTPMITKLMIINKDTNTQYYLMRILTDSIDTYLLNNNDININRMEGAAVGLTMLVKNTSANVESVVQAFLTLCNKLNYANTTNSNATNDIIGLALGLLLQPISILSKQKSNLNTIEATPTFFFFLSLVLKKFEILWEQKGWIDYCYDIIVNSKMLHNNNANDTVILKSLSSSLSSSLKSLKLKLSSSLRTNAINSDNIFVITISIIESIRVGMTLDVTYLLGYHDHENIHSNESCREGYLSLLETLLSSWVKNTSSTLALLNSTSATDNKSNKWTKVSLKERIVNCFNELISSLSSRIKSVRDVCSKYIVIIMDNFEWLLLSTSSASSSLYRLLDLLGPLSEKYNTYINSNSNIDSNNYTIIHEINYGDAHDQQPPRSKSDVSNNVYTILVIAYRWMIIGMRTMPSVMSLIMQNYVIKTTHLSSSSFEHLGVLLSKEMMFSQKPSYSITQSINKTTLSKIRAKASRQSLSGLTLKNVQTLRATFSNAYPTKMNKYNNISNNHDLVAVLRETNKFFKRCAKIDSDVSIGINIIMDNIWTSVAAIMRLNDLGTSAYEINAYILNYLQLSSLVVIAISCSEVTITVLDTWRWLLSDITVVGTHTYLHEAFGLFKHYLNNNDDNTSIIAVVDFINDYSSISNDDGHIVVIESIIDIFQGCDISYDSNEVQLSFLRLTAVALRMLSRITLLSSQQVLREKIFSNIISWFEISASRASSLSSSLSSSPSSAIDNFLALNTVLDHLSDDFNVWSTKGRHQPQGSSFGLVEAISFIKQIINSTNKTYDPLLLTYKESLVAVYMKGKEINQVSTCCQANTGPKKKTNFRTGFNLLVRSLLLMKMNLIAAWNIKDPFFIPYQSLINRCSKEYHNLINTKNYKALISTAWALSPTLSVHLASQLSHLDRQDIYSSSKPVSNIRLFMQCDITDVMTKGETVSIYLQNDVHIQCLGLDYEEMLKALLIWQPAPLYVIMDLLNRCNSLGGSKSSVIHFFSCFFQYIVRSFRAVDINELIFVIPQLVQLLRRDDFGCISDLLLLLSKSNLFFCHKLVWCLRHEQLINEKKSYGYCNNIVGNDPLPQLASLLLTRIMSTLSLAEQKIIREELTFFNAMTSISSKLRHNRKNKSQHQQLILEEVQKIPLYPQLRLPTNYNKIVVNVDTNSGKPMNSAAKCPFLLVFQTKHADVKVEQAKVSLFPVLSSPHSESPLYKNVLDPTTSEDDEAELKSDGQIASRPRPILCLETESDSSSDNSDIEDSDSPTTLSKVMDKVRETLNRSSKTPSPYPTHDSQKDMDAVIFKSHDDCRQDALTIQIICKLRDTFRNKGLELFLYPYEIMPIRIGDTPGGILQVIPNAQSRHQIGKNKGTLMSHFINEFGPVNSSGFRQAQQEFVNSLAGYSVVCYLLSIKDRHNGNIVVDGSGHIIHIDYGFILGISPGNNLGFENSAFKLTLEMISIMGGTNSTVYKRFVELAIKGFLASREIMDEILALVCAHADSGLPCFMFKDTTLTELRNRFFPSLAPLDAAKQFHRLINKSFSNITTTGYDCIQSCTNGIYC